MSNERNQTGQQQNDRQQGQQQDPQQPQQHYGGYPQQPNFTPPGQYMGYPGSGQMQMLLIPI